jgi:ribonuclease VapC
MTVIDTSVLVAIVFHEEGSPRLLDALVSASRPLLLSSVTWYETGIVIATRLGPGAIAELTAWLKALNVIIVDFNADAAALALEAYQQYGKGIHPACLNMGDCPAYALAKAKRAALLFTGNDFSKTDVVPALC